MNPARSLGPAIVGGELGSVWIYVAGPLMGASMAVFTDWVLKGPEKSQESKAAEG